MSPVSAIVTCALLLLTTIAGLCCVSYCGQPARGKHARAAVVPEPEPADPAGPHWDLAGDSCGTDEADWWDQQPPEPPAIAVLTAPGTRITQTSELTLRVLGRVRDALLPDAWRPEPSGEVTFTPADPDVTCTDLPAVTCTDLAPVTGEDMPEATAMAAGYLT